MKLTKIGSIGLVVFSLIFQACSALATENQLSVKTDSKANVQGTLNSEIPNSDPVQLPKEQEKPSKINFRDIENSRGLVAISDKRYEKDSRIRIYNQDGSIWYEYTNSGEDSSRLKFDENLLPFRKDADELLLIFDSVSEDDLYYQVVVNEKTGLKKFIRKDDPLFKFGNWEDFTLNCFAVSFDSEKNPMRREINGEIIKDGFQDEFLHPEEIRGEWLKVKWHPDDDREKPATFGWIRWKEDKKIVINFFEKA